MYVIAYRFQDDRDMYVSLNHQGFGYAFDDDYDDDGFKTSATIFFVSRMWSQNF